VAWSGGYLSFLFIAFLALEQLVGIDGILVPSIDHIMILVYLLEKVAQVFTTNIVVCMYNGAQDVLDKWDRLPLNYEFAQLEPSLQ